MSIAEPTQYTIPPVVSQSSEDDFTWAVDYTNLLGEGQTPITPTATLLSPAGLPVTLADACYISGNWVVQRIQAGVLATVQPGPTYYTLTVTAGISGGSTNVFAERLRILVPF